MTASVVSLCSGIGGIDLGLQRAGWTIAAQVEIDPFCQQVLARHWPEVPRFDDLTTLDPVQLPAADLVAAGFPCQPVSDAGRRQAQADERWLWPDVARVVGHLRPRWVLLENVPGLYRRGLGDVLGDLATLGYDAEWRCIAAADLAAPHLRERVWVVAYPSGTVGDTEVGRRGRPGLGQGQPGRAPEPGGPGSGGAESVLGGVLDGLPARVDRHRWPAGPREPQRDWEPPRTAGRGIAHRGRRVGALGNAVVPQIPELIGRAILAR